MNDFTPGPWVYDDDTATVDAGERAICGINVDEWDDETYTANARLIAAAPDMYDSLEPDALEAIADEIGSTWHNTARAQSLRGIAQRQRAAIAKADGS